MALILIMTLIWTRTGQHLGTRRPTVPIEHPEHGERRLVHAFDVQVSLRLLGNRGNDRRVDGNPGNKAFFFCSPFFIFLIWYGVFFRSRVFFFCFPGTSTYRPRATYIALPVHEFHKYIWDYLSSNFFTIFFRVLCNFFSTEIKVNLQYY